MSDRTPSRARSAFFALVVTAGALWAINAIVERLEGGGVVDTHSPDDRVQFLDSQLFEVQDVGPEYATTSYGDGVMVPQRFPVDRTGRWRLFWTGGSFAMGTPYVWQGHGAEMPGGMTWWLRNELERRWQDVSIDLVNLSTGGQNSHRVRRTVEQASLLGADAWFVATCNNEGALPPHMMQEQLHALGGYRLLAKYLRPAPERGERSYYTPQDEDSQRLARSFRENIAGIVEQTRQAGIPLLLATLPINLRWQGRNRDQPIIVNNDQPPGQRRCVREAVTAYRSTDYEGALEALEDCSDVVETLQWRGLSLLQLNRFDEGVAALEQSIELLPRNRCRPSFNTIIRQEAAKGEHVTLVDMDLAARGDPAVGGGAPGEELFLDYCHMHYDGYRRMADVVLEAMLSAGVTPPGPPKTVPPLDVDRAARRAGLTQLRFDDR